MAAVSEQDDQPQGNHVAAAADAAVDKAPEDKPTDDTPQDQPQEEIEEKKADNDSNKAAGVDFSGSWVLKTSGKTIDAYYKSEGWSWMMRKAAPMIAMKQIIDQHANTRLKLGDVVLLNQARVGVVRYIGHLDGRSQSTHDQYIGIEIRVTDGALGDSNGTFNNKTYFRCAPNSGLFIEPQQILQIYSPEDLLEMIINLKDKLLPLMSAQRCSNCSRSSTNSTNSTLNTTSNTANTPRPSRPSKKRKQSTRSSRGNSKTSNIWPSAPTMQYIQRSKSPPRTIPNSNTNTASAAGRSRAKSTRGSTNRVHVNGINKVKSRNRAASSKDGRNRSSGVGVKWSLQSHSNGGSLLSGSPVFSNPPILTAGLSGNLGRLSQIHENSRSTLSTYDDVDMNIAAPTGVWDYFSEDNSMASSPLHIRDRLGSSTSNGVQPGAASYESVASALSPGTKPMLNGTRTSGGSYSSHSTRSRKRTRLSIVKSYDGNLVSSQSKMRLLHRCVTLRTKGGGMSKKSLVLDLANFGRYLLDQGISEIHPWYDRIWNKYDKLFKMKIEFYFVNELLGDLLDEYLQYEYDTLSEQISTVDLKKAVQQIIIHVRPYHIEQHQKKGTMSDDEDGKSSHFEDDDDYDVLPFTFNDLCCLGEWLCEVEEMESEDDAEDTFMLDIHFWDLVQYVNSHRNHVWKAVVLKAVAINKKSSGQSTSKATKFNVKWMAPVLKAVLLDYGRNGLGNINMEIYEGQIVEYTRHLTRLCGEFLESERGDDHKTRRKSHMTRKQFFGFIASIPQLGLTRYALSLSLRFKIIGVTVSRLRTGCGVMRCETTFVWGQQGTFWDAVF